jgi:transcriptional regulator with XRE-family HTH domain
MKCGDGMISETLSSGLQQYQIGPKVRSLRLRKKLGLVELGRHTGLSAAMLSKIERGVLIPTLPTLLRIALVFSVSLEHFFIQETAQPQLAVIRKRNRIQLPERAGVKAPAYLFESLDFPITERKVSTYYASFLARGSRPKSIITRVPSCAGG